jgi:hypothetical protein
MHGLAVRVTKRLERAKERPLDFGNISLLLFPTRHLWLISLIQLNALIVCRDEHLFGLVWLAVRLFSREARV